MTDVGANVAGTAQADHGIEVRPIHVHLTAIFVDDVANFLDRRFENTVRRRIGHHQRSEVVPVLLGLGPEVAHIDVALVVRLNHHHLHPGHYGARRVGTVSRSGDQTDRTMRLSLRLMVRVDGQEPRELALRAGVRLQGNPGESGHFRQIPFQCLEHLLVPCGLILRGEGVQPTELPPSDGNHFRGGVEFQRAGSQGNHR